jgi:transposase
MAVRRRLSVLYIPFREATPPFPNALATAAPDWVRTHVPTDWFGHYGPRAEERRMPTGEKEREQRAEAIGRDGYAPLDAVPRPDAPDWLRLIPAVNILRQVWVQSYLPLADGGLRWRQKDEVPPASVRISSPYDMDARRCVSSILRHPA